MKLTRVSAPFVLLLLGVGTGLARADDVRVITSNDLGMHCMDREFSVFSILPPYNVVHAQIVRRVTNGAPRLLNTGRIDVRYSPITDARGSFNSTSIGKTDFWTFVTPLFGVSLPPGQGLAGLFMPADAPVPGPQALRVDPARHWFVASGIPITPIDDARNMNPYPLLRISVSYRGQEYGHTDVVAPVSEETDCQNCHTTGRIAAADPGIVWSTNSDLELQAKTNVLILHDARTHTHLLDSTPVLCARCHYSAALDLAGAGPQGEQVGKPTMSSAMHAFHGSRVDSAGHLVFPRRGTVEQTCYQCHPGLVTQCQRGAMRDAGLRCKDCHGVMESVGGQHSLLPGGSIDGLNDGHSRRPWMDLPRCQSCHTGDAVDHLVGPDYVVSADGITFERAFRRTDLSASPLLATNTRFAENPGALYRFSYGHGGVFCEGCHGSTHAEWPNGDPAHNDNVAAMQLQGHTGMIIECTACHGAGTLPPTLAGPHGMHNVNDRIWVSNHHDFYERNQAQCRACHGVNLEGTALSRAAANRSFSVEGRTIDIPKGALVSCTLCHEQPGTGD
ncbi:MAG: hypothetical protein HYR85_27440 [Planctomycetes bacterium]|nr:hypothetical protein [Planctomycetota bacterium]